MVAHKMLILGRLGSLSSVWKQKAQNHPSAEILPSAQCGLYSWAMLSEDL